MTTAALPVSVALVSESQQVALHDLAAAAAALQQQVQRDFAPLWHVSATVTPFPAANQVPTGHWPIIIRDRLDEPGALGYHTDAHRQPVSYVEATDDWTVTCSHELLEMLADPWGSRLWAARSPTGDGTRVRILVEVSDPCEAITYEVGGIHVSDFATPAFFHTVKRLGSHYSFTGALTVPREIIAGGYMSFIDATGQWQQVTWFGQTPKVRNVDAEVQVQLAAGTTLREAVDLVTRGSRA